MKISWDEAALAAFGDAMEYIANDSYTAALAVAEDIDEALQNASHHPRSHPPDRYRQDGDATFRAFELHSFQISYRIELDSLIVVRFRHTRQQPLSY